VLPFTSAREAIAALEGGLVVRMEAILARSDPSHTEQETGRVGRAGARPAAPAGWIGSPRPTTVSPG